MKAKALSPEKYFFLRRIFIFFLSNLLAVSSFISCKQHKKTSADSQVSENVVAVKTVPATRKNLNIPIHCSGILTSNAEIKLAFKVGGVVERIYVKEGQFVRRGQLLAQL
ncbi:MAG: biotin/lipoyl-binding protein, partial [Verrucomicrobia bacterium]|nr:biotin/lipoyl-binding protein [Cytophagales bacterium]